jgi:hypothetical protein
MSLANFTPQGVNNSGQAAYWRVALGEDAAREFNYLWHQYGRLVNIWSALQDWLDAAPEDRYQVVQKLGAFNGVILDAMWTTLLVVLAAFGNRRRRPGAEPMGIPAWLDRHASIFPRDTETVRLQMEKDLVKAFRPIKKLRNTRLAHWDSKVQVSLGVHRAEVTRAMDQVEHSFRRIEACFSLDHLGHHPPFNYFLGMKAYIRLVKESPLRLEDPM